jgi:hypothetical protein
VIPECIKARPENLENSEDISMGKTIGSAMKNKIAHASIKNAVLF